MKQFLAIMLLLSVAACSGYSPLYKEGSGAVAGLSSVRVAPISDRLGQQVRGHLLDGMPGGGNAVYELVLTLDDSTRGFGIRPDAAATQEEITVTGKWSLIELATGEAVASGEERASESTDQVLSDFANMTQREDTRRRLALLVADEVQMNLAAWFAAQAGVQ